MAESTDSSLAFFSKASPNQWSYVLSLYKDVLSLKASLRTKKGGPQELIKLDTWYQEQLPKIIKSRKDTMLLHEELVQIMKWKLMRGKFRPRLIDLVKINTELAVKNVTKKAFKKMPNLSGAITAMTTLKGIGPATASAVLAAGFPEYAPYMADESMLATPGVEATDYTLAEYLNYAEQIQACTDRLKKQDPKSDWTPHKVELTLWTHYLAREMKPALLDDLPAMSDTSHNAKPEENADVPNGSEHKNEESNGATSHNAEGNGSASSSEKLDASDDSSQSSSKAGDDSNSAAADEVEQPAPKKLRV